MGGGNPMGMTMTDHPESAATSVEFEIIPSRVLRILLVTIALLIALSIAGQAMLRLLPDFLARDALARFLSVDAEQSLPTLYSVAVLSASALLALIIARTEGSKDRRGARYWAVTSAVFAYLALDEFASLHELATEPVSEILDIGRGPLWFAWVIPATIAVGFVAVASLRFFRRLPGPTRRRLRAAGLMFVAGAIGFEVIGSAYASDHGQTGMAYVLIASTEESLEMIGATLAFHAILAYIPLALPDVTWRIRVRSTPP